MSATPTIKSLWKETGTYLASHKVETAVCAMSAMALIDVGLASFNTVRGLVNVNVDYLTFGVGSALSAYKYFLGASIINDASKQTLPASTQNSIQSSWKAAQAKLFSRTVHETVIKRSLFVAAVFGGLAAMNFHHGHHYLSLFNTGNMCAFANARRATRSISKLFSIEP